MTQEELAQRSASMMMAIARGRLKCGQALSDPQEEMRYCARNALTVVKYVWGLKPGDVEWKDQSKTESID